MQKKEWRGRNNLTWNYESLVVTQLNEIKYQSKLALWSLHFQEGIYYS